MAEIIQLDEDLSPAISALAHSLSAEIDEDNVPSDKFENVANILLNGLLDLPKNQVKAIFITKRWQGMYLGR